MSIKRSSQVCLAFVFAWGVCLSSALPAALTPQMTAGIADARYVPRYSKAQRAQAARTR
jgi:hypothetical protein